MVIHSKNVNSACNRTVFKLRSSIFTGSSATSRDRSWRGSKFHGTQKRSDIKGQSLKKRNFDVQSPSYQVKKFKLHRIVNVSSGQVVERFTILPTLESISIKRIVCLCLSLSLSVCLDAFAQFLSYEVQASLDCQRISGTGRGGDYDSTPPRRSQKYRVNHSKNVISTCNLSVF